MKENIKELFQDWNETIIWSCLQGVMGDVRTNSDEDAAMAILGDFAFFAGKPSEEMVMFMTEDCEKEFLIMVPQNEEWGEVIERCYDKMQGKLQDMQSKKKKIFLMYVNWRKQFWSCRKVMK